VYIIRRKYIDTWWRWNNKLWFVFTLLTGNYLCDRQSFGWFVLHYLSARSNNLDINKNKGCGGFIMLLFFSSPLGTIVIAIGDETRRTYRQHAATTTTTTTITGSMMQGHPTCVRARVSVCVCVVTYTKNIHPSLLLPFIVNAYNNEWRMCI